MIAARMAPKVTPRMQAVKNHMSGLGMGSNPYQKGTPESDGFMANMSRLQWNEFENECGDAASGEMK